MTEQEILGNLIYKILAENMGNRADIADILSEAIIEDGWMSPKMLLREGYYQAVPKI